MKPFLLLTLCVLSNTVQGFENVSYEPKVLQTNQTPVEKIVNGQNASPNQFPHQALIYLDSSRGSSQCGGSVINSLWVLCAGHCTFGATSAQVLLGSTNASAMPVRRNAVKFEILPSYDPVTLRDDISLIKVDKKIPFSSRIAAIQLPAKSQASATYLNSVLIVSGFGLTTANEVSTSLQYTQVIGISNAECRKVYGSSLPKKVLCARGYINRDQASCQGDSGGGLISNSTIVGIVSFGTADSCSAGFPEGYTRVGSYLSWITSITGIKIKE